MLKITRKEAAILDGLLMAEAKIVAERENVPIAQVYNTKSYFLRKVQNAQDFLAVANSKYKPLLSRRLTTPKIMPEDDEGEREGFRA